jgi:hypothetical protein
MDMSANQSPYVTCPCQHCSGHIEFDSFGFQKGETRTVECPFCKLETMVFLPVQSIAPKQTTIAASRQEPYPPATKPSSGQIESFRRKLTSQVVAVFFAFTTFCLASILIWEHLASRSQLISGDKIAQTPKVTPKPDGSDTVNLGFAKYRLDELILLKTGNGLYEVRQKSNGQFLSYINSINDKTDVEKISAYLDENSNR